MLTRRPESLILAFLLFSLSLQPVRAGPGPTPDARHLAVGLLSSRDEQPVALVEPADPGGWLFLTMIGVAGERDSRLVSGQLFIALAAGPDPGPPADRPAADRATPFTVQAGSFGTAAAAESFAGEVRGHWPEREVRVVRAPLGGGRTAHRVMVGRFSDRRTALAFTATLAAYGMDGAFVVSERGRQPLAASGGRPLVIYNRATGLLRDLRSVEVSMPPRAAETPGEERPVFRLDGAPYRGGLRVWGGASGVVAVNEVALEAYLPGVVPCELGPDRFPLIEALKAQAVAARTYAMKHAGRHRAEGFDLCDTPHCQVYGGAGRELPLSSEAVRQTAGLAAWYGGELAETLYTSTCGGHTETSSDVFRGPAEPYLRGVPCTVDRVRAPVAIDPASLRPPRPDLEDESGMGLGFALDLLERIGLPAVPADLALPVTSGEAASWLEGVTGRRVAAPAGDGAPDRCTLAGMVCRSLGWSERLPVLYSPADVEEIAGGRDRSALAHLLHERIFLRMPDGGAGGAAAMSRGRFAAALARLALYIDPGLFAEGVLRQSDGQALIIRFGEENTVLPVSREGLGLFERRGAVHRAIDPRRLRSGDRVRYHRDRTGAVDLLVRLPAEDGAAADRYSPYNRWSIVVSREEIEKLLEENGHRIGRLVDLEPLERGSTGRLVRLRAVGTAGSVTLRGLDIRWNLGTRENLFFIDRIPGAGGENRSYRFTGRGWGHGVGLCQVGAVGLAEAGADYIEILQHYYPGIVIRPAAAEAVP